MSIITKFSGLTPVLPPSAVNAGENSYKPRLLWNHSSLASFLSRMASSESRNKRQACVKRAVRKAKAHFKLNWTFKVIQGNPYWCQQESRTVCCRNVPLIPTLFLKLTKTWQWENGNFVDFNDPTQVWRRPTKKRLRISTNGLYCHKLELLIYILPLILWVYIH